MSSPPDQSIVTYQPGVQGRRCSDSCTEGKKSIYYENLPEHVFNNLFLEACDFTTEGWNIMEVSDPARKSVWFIQYCNLSTASNYVIAAIWKNHTNPQACISYILDYFDWELKRPLQLFGLLFLLASSGRLYFMKTCPLLKSKPSDAAELSLTSEVPQRAQSLLRLIKFSLTLEGVSI